MKKIFIFLGVVGVLLIIVFSQNSTDNKSPANEESITNDSRSASSESSQQSTFEVTNSNEESVSEMTDFEQIKERNNQFVPAYYDEDMGVRSTALRPLLTDSMYGQYGEFEPDLDDHSTSVYEGFSPFYSEIVEGKCTIVNLVGMSYEDYMYTVVMTTTYSQIEGQWLVSDIAVQLINPATTQ